MNQFINKHAITIQVGAAVMVLVTMFMWGFGIRGYAKDIENNAEVGKENKQKIEKVETKLDDLATKEDLQILKQDIKDFIK